jgi:hypothetical protein
MNPQKQEKWLDEVLNSLDGIQPAAAPPNLLEKAMRRAQERPAMVVPLRSRQSWAMAASFALLLTANIWVCLGMNKTQQSANAAENFGRTYFSFVQTPDF